MLEMISEILKLVAMYGLPIVLTVWFVLRIDVAITKLIVLLEAFIGWMKDNEEEKEKQNKEIKELLVAIKDRQGEVINKINIMEVRLEK